MSLANRYRPAEFSEVVGQGIVVDIVKKMCESTELSNRNFLFTGPAGTGKTTLGRLIAKALNGTSDNIIEIDAASHSGVDDMREIVHQAQQYPIGTKYKIFILDECFPKNAQVLTTSGYKNISDILTSDTVYSMTGAHKVTHIFRNRVLTNRLCCVKVNGRNIITTLDHLFFTNNGWIEAKNLHSGDIVYANNVYKNLSSMPESLSSSEQSQICDLLFAKLREQISLCSEESRREIQSTSRNEDLPYLSKFIYCNSEQQAENLFEDMREGSYFETVSTVAEYRIWDGTVETIFRKNAEGQSDVTPRDYREDAEYQRKERDSSSMERRTGWQWEVHDSPDSLIRSIRGWLGVRISDKHKSATGLEDNECTLVLQSRPWLSSEEVGSRGRWGKPSIERCFIERCEEDGLFTEVRVDSIEIYQRGNNDELFRGSFSDTELSQEYVIMYDLEVEGDHNYIVDGILVHNCHALSNTAWQSALKIIEEQAAMSVFIFCTTNPEKIPATIISRVQTFKLSKISSENIYKRLKYVMDAEIAEGRQLTYSDDALKYLSRLANGGLRDALTMLDKVLAYGSDVTPDLLEKALDLPNYDTYFELLNSLVKRDNESTARIVDNVYNSGTNFIKWFEGFHSFLCNIVKFVLLKNINYTMIPSHYIDKLEKYNEQHVAICLKFSTVILNMIKDLKMTQYQQETCLTYLLSSKK